MRRDAIARMTAAALELITLDEDYADREVGTLLALGTAVRDHGPRARANASPSRHSPVSGNLALGIARCAEKLGRYGEALATLHRVRRTATCIPLAGTWSQIGNVSLWISHHDDALAAYRRALDVAQSKPSPTLSRRAAG